MKSLREILEILRCPDCFKKLFLERNQIICTGCKRAMYHKGKFIDLLPSKPLEVFDAFSQKAARYYYTQFSVASDKKYRVPTAWGSLDLASVSYKVFTAAEFSVFRQHFPDNKRIFCDISASSGVHSFAAAKHFETVLHCDINLEYLQFAMKKARRQMCSNIWFLRTDYLQLPFAPKSISMAISTDSLIYYGPRYDKEVIQQVESSLQTGGVFCFDLHAYKWYYPDQCIFEYRKETLSQLESNNYSINWHSFGRVPVVVTPSRILFTLTQKLSFLPPVRYIGIIKKNPKRQ